MLSLRRAALIAQSIKSKLNCELYIFWVHIFVTRNQYDIISQDEIHPYIMQRKLISFRVDMMSQCGNIFCAFSNKSKKNFSPCYKD